MNVKNKKIIIFGLGVTGISSLKTLSKHGAKVYLYTDSKNDEFNKQIKNLSDYQFEIIEKDEDINWKDISYLIKSPGIKPTNRLIEIAKSNEVPVISDIEMAILLYENLKYIAITGTNGKTTTTSMVAHLLNVGSIKARVVGNIGIGILEEIERNGLDTTYVMELSSFQLDATPSIHADLTLLLNISPDHIDWHGSYEEYVKAKLNIVKNLGSQDKLILNFDDKIKDYISENPAFETRYISTREFIEKGSCFIDDRFLIEGKNSGIIRADLNLVGNHNVQNALFAIEAANHFKIPIEKIKEGIKTFKAIEHRLEYVAKIKGASYYNDSKGTNIDSTKKALNGFEKNVYLIAGGYDKGGEFDQLFENNKCIKQVLVFGQTKNKIAKACEKHGISNKIFNNLDQIIDYTVANAKEGEIVLLSPACASWDMYKSYEERGNHFKRLVEDHR